MNTPHINLLDDIGFGRTVLMPGDPLRAKFIAENFLENPVAVNNVRGVNGYTGYYKGVKVSVMASGMGIPSIGIYSYELYKNFGVENIIRVGTVGSISEECGLRDVIACMGACTDSSFGNQYGLDGNISAVCNFELIALAKKSAIENKIPLKTGSLLSSDVFYNDTADISKWAKMGVLGVEMEAAGLYMTAMRLGMRALALCTVSNLCIPPYSELSAEERRTTLTDMIKIALETAAAIEEFPHPVLRK